MMDIPPGFDYWGNEELQEERDKYKRQRDQLVKAAVDVLLSIDNEERQIGLNDLRAAIVDCEAER